MNTISNMSNNMGAVAIESNFPINSDGSRIEEQLINRTDGNLNGQQSAFHYGGTDQSTADEDAYYDDAGSLFYQQLVLVKELKSLFDIRYKTDYFPRGGKNAGIPQPPRYLHTVDDKQDIIIKFPLGYRIPQKLLNYFIEVALVTVPRMNQVYWHVNKFQLDNTDINVLDNNPFFIPLTLEHFQAGQVAVKLVIIKTTQNDLNKIQSLSSFDGQASGDWTGDCKTVNDLQHTYELSSVRVAFSLVYKRADGQFVRFTNTTVLSNEIVEKEKSKSSEDITCPHCSHSFSLKEQKKTTKKRSGTSSATTNKKRRPNRKATSE